MPIVLCQKTDATHGSGCTIPTVKHKGGCIILQGLYSLGGTGTLFRVDGKTDGGEYQTALEENLLETPKL